MMNNIEFDCKTHSDRFIELPSFLFGSCLLSTFLATCAFGVISQLDLFPFLDVGIGRSEADVGFIGPLVGQIVAMCGEHLPSSHLTHGQQFAGVL